MCCHKPGKCGVRLIAKEVLYHQMSEIVLSGPVCISTWQRRASSDPSNGLDHLCDLKLKQKLE